MSGICGIAYSHPKRAVDPSLLGRMLNTMAHRGSDIHPSYIASQVGLGVRGLGIQDPTAGDRPVSNKEGTITVVCSGEIYNSPELKKALVASGHRIQTCLDAEVILHLYEDHGVQCLNRLRGMFGIALWDTRIRRLMLGRDRLGIQPLFYGLTDDGLWFGSELKAILMGGSVNREMDHQALKDLFTIGFVSGPNTLFSNIRRLLPGHYLLYQDGALSLHQYWDVSFPELDDGSYLSSAGEWAEALKSKLQESVRIHLRGNLEIGGSLSAGIDSSGIVSLMSQVMSRPIQTFSLGYEYAPYDEVTGVQTLEDFPGFRLSNQRVMCKKNDFALYPQAVWHCEDPFTTGLEIPRMLLSGLASAHVRVMLTGDGSDEIFGAYPWFRVDQALRQVMRLPLKLRQIIARMPAIKKRWSRACRRLNASAEMNRACYKQIIDSVHEDYDVSLFAEDRRSSIPSEDDACVGLPAGYEAWHPVHQLLYWELKMHLPDYTLRRLDATSMANSLEARVPFLDHELVEFCSHIPMKYVMGSGEDKYIFRLAMRDVVPLEIINRTKRGLLAPYDQWIEDPPEFAIELLSERQIREKGYFDPKMVSALFRMHQRGDVRYGRTLMGVLGIQLWHDLFVQGCRPS